MTIDLSYALGLEPAAAVKYFESKGHAITWNWRQNWQEANAKAFTVAGVTKVDVLQDIRGELSKALKDGNTFAQFRADLQPILERKGWWGAKSQTDKATGEVHGKGLTPRRLQTIFDTNVQSSYMAGRWTEAMQNVDDRPYFQYVALHGGHRRPMHQLLDQRVFHYDDPLWDSLCPTNGYGCKCRFRTLSQSDVDGRGLSVSSGASHMETVQVPYSRHSKDTVEVVGYRDPVSKKLITPDPGFSYNAGQSWTKPFTPPPLDTLPATMHPGIALPELMPPTKVSLSRILPADQPASLYTNAFMHEFGVTPASPVVFQDVMGESLPINPNLFNGPTRALQGFTREQAPYARLLADAIRTPDEIWLHWEESALVPGSWVLKRRYLQSVAIEGAADTETGVSVVGVGSDGWSGKTTMVAGPQDRQSVVEKLRAGFLLYRRKSR